MMVCRLLFVLNHKILAYMLERGQNANCFVARIVDYKCISMKKRTWSL